MKNKIKKLLDQYDYSFYDYYPDDMNMEYKYYIKNRKYGKYIGFDRLIDIIEYIDELKNL